MPSVNRTDLRALRTFEQPNATKSTLVVADDVVEATVELDPDWNAIRHFTPLGLESTKTAIIKSEWIPVSSSNSDSLTVIGRCSAHAQCEVVWETRLIEHCLKFFKIIRHVILRIVHDGHVDAVLV